MTSSLECCRGQENCNNPLDLYYLQLRELGETELIFLAHRDNAAIPSFLLEGLPSLPEGYVKEGCNVLLHTSTGIRCWAWSLDMSTESIRVKLGGKIVSERDRARELFEVTLAECRPQGGTKAIAMSIIINRLRAGLKKRCINEKYFFAHGAVKDLAGSRIYLNEEFIPQSLFPIRVVLEDRLIVLYHYCPEEAFKEITSTGRLFVSTSLGTDCDFGAGQYATKKAPHDFQSIQQVLYNNYPRATTKFRPCDAGFPKEDRASFCVPVIVCASMTPALPLTDPDGPCGAVCESKDRHGSFNAEKHNIWVVDCRKTLLFRSGLRQSDIALVAAVRQNQIEVVKQLLVDGASVHVVGGDGIPPLLDAVCARNADIVKLLLAAGASPNQKCEDGSGYSGETVWEAVKDGSQYDEILSLFRKTMYGS